MATINTNFKVKNGLDVSGNATVQGTITATTFIGDGSGLTGVSGGGGVTSYNDLTDKPNLFSGSYTDLTNKPNLFSGSYNDLSDKPSIPNVPNVISYFMNDAGYITNSSLSGYATTSSLSTVATSGSYNDLTNKPTIPSLSGYATETYVNTQVANLVDSSPETLNTLNELAQALSNDPNFATTVSNQIGSKADASSLATVATSGSYNDLTNKPTLFDASSVSSSIVPSSNQIYELGSSTNKWGNVHTTQLYTQFMILNGSTGSFGQTIKNGGSGGISWGDVSYNDLTDKPTLGTAASTDSTAYATAAQGTKADTALQSYTETDPIYVASTWYTTTNNSSNWDTAYSWGNHASAGYLTNAVTSATAGTGMSVSSSTGGVTFTNTAPMTYAGAGIPVSTGTAWGTSLTVPNGSLVGTAATQTLTNKTLTSPVLTTATTSGRFIFGGSIDETVFAVTGTTPALSPSNGTIQTWTLTGNSTPTQGTFVEGESMTLMINDGSNFAITWTSIPITWVGGSAPTLATTGFTVIELWEVGTTIYGALVGTVA